MTESKPVDYLDGLPTIMSKPEITFTSSTCTSNLLPAPSQTIQTQSIQQVTPTVSTTREMASMYLLDQDQANSSNISTIAPTDDPALSVGVELIPCPICNRTFNPNTLQKHVGICEKMATKKRNVFDSSRQRREGTELATYPLPKNFGLPTGNINTPSSMTASIIRCDRGQSPKPHKTDSPILARKKSQDEFTSTTNRTSMRKRSNSASSSSRVSTTPANTHVNISPTSNANPTNSVAHPVGFTRDRMRSSERSLSKRIQPPPAEQCPHCERCFGIKAYDRHVEWCKEKALQAAIKQNSRNDQNIAKERLEARTKYRAPCLKTKRSINRDKYSGFTPDENDPAIDSPKSSNSKNLMSLSMTSSITSDRNVTISGIVEAATTKTKMHTNKMEHHGENAPRKYDVQHKGTFTLQPRPSHDFNLMCQKLEAYDHKEPTTQDQEQQQQLRETMVPTENENGCDKSNSKKNTTLILAKKTTTEEKCRGMYTVPHAQVNGIVNNESNDLTTTLLLQPRNNACMLRAAKQTVDGTQPKANLKERRKSKSRQQPCINQTQSELMHQQPQQKHKFYQTEQNQKPKTTECSASKNSLSEFMPQGQPENAEQAIYKSSQTATTNKKTAITATTELFITTAMLNTKLDTNPIKATPLYRPKRKKLSRQLNITTNTAPLKAVPLLNENIEKFSSNTTDVSSLLNCNRYNDKQIKIIEAPIRVRLSTPPPPSPLTRNRSFILSGIPCNYDPFLSAKRQLEELCLPISPTDTLSRNITTSDSTPSTPCINAALPAKMTTSLTLNISTSQSSPLTLNNSHNRLNNALTSTPASKTSTPSNFRRTSSLRGSRRSPMLSSRPLFAQKQRPTIQRGLSDEGPISTNFLKPEEYDEMPVRAVCVNDFAITNSPRVMRRDTSSSNRKQYVSTNTSQESATTNTPLVNATNITEKTVTEDNNGDEPLTANSKHLSKTDSLTVFLKYENDLEKLPITNVKSISNLQPSKICSSMIPQVPDFESPVITKELKDKSNNLSKQNSTKSMKQFLPLEEENEVQKPKTLNSGILLPTPVSQTQNLLELPKKNSLSNINFTKNSTLHLEPISKTNTLLSATASSIYKANCNEAFPNLSKELPPVINQFVNLNAIFDTCKATETNTLLNKETQNLSHNEYIDPKLINKCDNLPVNLNKYFAHKATDSNSSDSEPHPDISASPTDIITTSTNTAFTPVFQHSKLPQHTKYNESFVKLHPVYSNEARPVRDHPTGSCNISEGRNVLKRKMRLGRNQFLYDASPEPESSMTNDKFNHLSAKSNNQQHNQQSKPIASTSQSQSQTQTQISHQQPTTRQRPPPLPLPAPFDNIPHIPQIPTFDNFNFEEFLSSFEHDDEQFPLFKDCREFLLNRTSSKQRSTLTSNSNIGSVNDTKNQSRQSPITPTHFQFPNVHNNNNPLQTFTTSPSSSSSSFLRSRNNCNIIDRESGQKTSGDGRNSPVHGFNKPQTIRDQPPSSNEDNKKREIFISIETEQNDLERSPISPDSLRNMVGNPQTMIEVEIDATDNKFSRISDDEPMPRTPSPFNTLAREDLPNVQLNNAKNLIQKMQDDFRQMSEEVGVNLRQAVKTCSSHRSSATGTPRSVSNTTTTTAIPTTTNTMPSAYAGMESDDMSSLDGYPILSQSSRRGISSKLSADSAYGSLSRQRSLDTSTHHNRSLPHPSTISVVTNTALPTNITNTVTQSQQQQQQLHSKQSQTATPYNKYNSTKSRTRQRSGSSSSGSDNSLPPITHTNHNLNLKTCNTAYKQQLSQIYSNNNINNNFESPLSSPTINLSATNITAISHNDPNANHSRSNSISNSNSSLKMSKFCHECGGKFIIENAKFCTDCGVRRIIL